MSPLCPASDLLVARLRQYGVHQVFGYPGGQLTPIYDSLYREPTITHRLARHEQAAAFMADGFARATGLPGVCLAVCGPGVYNAATPLASALSDSVPVLLISGQIPRAGVGLRSGYYHENEQLAAARHFTKAQVRIESTHGVVDGVDRAWRHVSEGRPGPVLLEVPLDVLRAEVAAGPMPPLPPAVGRVAPEASDVRRVADIVSRWRKPIILAGGGVVRSGAEKALAGVAMRLGAPVFHTANGKCALPSSHPLAAGMPWWKATSDLTQMTDFFSPLWKQSDGLLAVGCRFTQMATGTWSIPLPASRVHVDVDPDETHRHYFANWSIHADARATLEALHAALPAGDRPPWTAIPPCPEPWRLPAIEVLTSLRRALPRDGIVVADVTRLAYVLMADLQLDCPRTFLHPAGAVCMGYALPAALGAKAAFPDRKVVAVLGDGGFQMCAMELASAVQEKLPVVVLLVNDRCLTLIKSTQQRRYASRFIGVDLENPDFATLARSFGVAYWLAENDADLDEALPAAFAANVPALVEVRL